MVSMSMWNEDAGSHQMEVRFGTAHPPREFFRRAIAACHPLEREAEVPDSPGRAALAGPTGSKDATERLDQGKGRAKRVEGKRGGSQLTLEASWLPNGRGAQGGPASTRSPQGKLRGGLRPC